MLRKAGKHLTKTTLTVSMLNAGAEEIPLATASMDTVLLGNYRESATMLAMFN